MEELKPAFDILGDILETFITISDELEPVSTKFDDNVVITRSFTSVSHFEPDTINVLELYGTLSGKDPQKLLIEDEKEKEEK